MRSLAQACCLSLVVACGCTSSSSQAPTKVDVRAAPSSSTASTSSAPQGIPASEWQGSWESSSCGERRYPRRLTLAADGTFTMTDLVSPCPPGAKCIWSGVIARKGTWTVSGDRASLQYDPAGSGTANGKGVPAPAELQWNAEKRAPAEGPDCVYARR